MTDDPYSILKGWIAYAENRPYDRDAQELKRLSEACLEKLLPYKTLDQLKE